MATSFIIGFTSLGSLHNDFDGPLGALINMTADIQVVQLGRYAAGVTNSDSHTVHIVDAISLLDVASVSVNMAGATQGTFVYSSISPITLTKDSSYYLLSDEVHGGDQWLYEPTTAIPNTGIIVSYAYYDGVTYNTSGGFFNIYGAPDFMWNSLVTGSFFRSGNLSGLGSGGPFFQNPLG